MRYLPRRLHRAQQAKDRLGADEKDNLLVGAGLLDLLVEFERFRRGVSANVEHHEIVDIGLPQKSYGGNLLSLMHLDSATPQDRSAYLARSLAAIDQENFLIGKSRAATKWRAIHRTLPKRARPLQEGGSSKVCAESGGEST